MQVDFDVDVDAGGSVERLIVLGVKSLSFREKSQILLVYF